MCCPVSLAVDGSEGEGRVNCNDDRLNGRKRKERNDFVVLFSCGCGLGRVGLLGGWVGWNVFCLLFGWIGCRRRTRYFLQFPIIRLVQVLSLLIGMRT